jgi:hypothetical protein
MAVPLVEKDQPQQESEKRRETGIDQNRLFNFHVPPEQGGTNQSRDEKRGH